METERFPFNAIYLKHFFVNEMRERALGEQFSYLKAPEENKYLQTADKRTPFPRPFGYREILTRAALKNDFGL